MIFLQIVFGTINWDFFIGASGQPFKSFVWWNDDTENAYPGKMGWTGPTAIKRPRNNYSTGFEPQGTLPSATADPQANGIPNGPTIYTTTDGSAHTTDVRGDVMKPVLLSSGKYVTNKFWPGSHN